MTESVNPKGTKHHYNNGLAEGSWKGMKKYLEQEMLCEALRGRVRYDLTWYPKFGGLSATFTVLLDGAAVKKFGTAYAGSRLKEQGFPLSYVDDVQRIPFSARDEFTDDEFSDALKAYRNQEIGASLASENPIVRMLAIVDRRVGKRRLESLREAAEGQPEWLRRFCLARLQAEGVSPCADFRKEKRE